MKFLLGLPLVPLLTAVPTIVHSIQTGLAPLLSSSNAQEIPDSYIVVFKNHVDFASADGHYSWVQDIHHQAESARFELKVRSPLPFKSDIFKGLRHTFNVAGTLLGYSGHFDKVVIDHVRRHPDVAYIEKDTIVHTTETIIEKNAAWGLARISHRNSLDFGTFNEYLYASDGGEDVDIYVIDTGTNVNHADFEGRANWGRTITLNDVDDDENGHGTHCAGTIAGRRFGVAKKANIHAVKVLGANGSGSMSNVVKGVEWVTTSHSGKKGKAKGLKGSVANMSLGGGKSITLESAINTAVDAGVHFAVSAGNDNADSCQYSPAAAEKAITVGASTLADDRASFSNYGACNDIFAPGQDILSTWIGSKEATNTISGTSMASPHIAGLLAYFLSLQPSQDSAFAAAEISPKKAKEILIVIGTKGALSNVPSDTVNVLAWNGGGSSNFTDIVARGGYTVEAGDEEDMEEMFVRG
jgi:cerevisin